MNVNFPATTLQARLDRGSVTRATRRFVLWESNSQRLPLPFNEADEVSCRAGAIKCSRCRTPFAPIQPAVAGRKLGPPLTRSGRAIKRNKELSLVSQAHRRSQIRPRVGFCLTSFLRWGTSLALAANAAGQSGSPDPANEKALELLRRNKVEGIVVMQNVADGSR